MIFVPDVFLFFHIQIYLKHHCLSKRQILNPQKYIASTWRHIISCKFIENRCFSKYRKHQYGKSVPFEPRMSPKSDLPGNSNHPHRPLHRTFHNARKGFWCPLKKDPSSFSDFVYVHDHMCYMNSHPSPMHSRIISSHIKSWSQTENAIRSI